MDDDLDDDPSLMDGALLGVIAWLLVPFVVGRLVDANLSTTLGNWARPTVVLVMLVWTTYRPAESGLKIALLLAINLLLLIGLTSAAIAFVIALVVANFDFRAVYGPAWLSPVAAVVLGAVRTAFGRWFRRDFQRLRDNGDR